MSCIRFNTPAQRRQLAAMAPSMLTPEEAARLHRSPEVTETKIARLRLLATNPNSKIRERAALDAHTPEDVMATLAADPDEDVRSCVARNEATSCDILRSLADDPSERVRGFLAINYLVPADTMERLAADESRTVRDLARWKRELASADLATV
jgi:hypothetical protein